jgi:hypothetical protein
MNKNINPETVKQVRRLVSKLENLLQMESNIEIIWQLEAMQFNCLLKNAADKIRNSIK